jgi:predicted component of type VI protein secretion system
MTLRLRIAGPGLDVSRTLQPHDPPLILGRDADCGVCLPDPQRNVSRRHLSVWNEDDELHFHVLSVVNGVQTSAGDAPPGARGVLVAGQTLKLAEYGVSVERTAPETGEDAWAVFDREASGMAPLLPESQPRPASQARIEEDPFGDWGFETTFGPGGLAGGPLESDTLGLAQDLAGFFRGLGLDPAAIGALSEGELEAIGRLVRGLALGTLTLHAASLKSKQDLNAEDRTMLGVRGGGINPLKASGPDEAKLRYLFGGRAAGAGFIAPERAVADLLSDLAAHENATRVAARAAIEGTLREFDPELLKSRLLGGGAKLFESARAWDAYVKFYAEQREQLPRWAQQLLDRHFAEAYVRETVRTKGRG